MSDLRLDPGVEISTLPNGVTVVSQAMPHLKSATIGLWVGSGSRYESKELNGISHLLEHMAFKSTQNRSARQMAEEIEAVGGEINAATAQETTAYFARVLAPDTELALGLIGEMLLKPKFDAEELKREKGVILQEIAGAADMPEDLVFEEAEAVAYPDQPLGRPILGSKQSVTRIKAADLRAHLKTHYNPHKMVVCGTGAIGHDAVVRQATDLFGGLTGPKSNPFEPARFSGGVRAVKKDVEQHQVLLAFEGPSYRDPRYYGTQVLTALLGGGTSSRLFQKVREDRGLCYAIDAFAWGYADSGLIGVHAGTGSEMVEELTRMVLAELADLAERGPDPAELMRARSQFKAGLLMSQESTAARAEQLARQILAFGRPETAETMIERINEVTAKTVREIAGALFKPDKLVWSEVGSNADGKFSELARKALA